MSINGGCGYGLQCGCVFVIWVTTTLESRPLVVQWPGTVHPSWAPSALLVECPFELYQSLLAYCQTLPFFGVPL